LNVEKKKKLFTFVFIFLFIITVASRYNLNKQEIDLSRYHLNIQQPKSYLIAQKEILTYNKDENSLDKITYIVASDGKIVSQSHKLYIPSTEELSNSDWIVYNKGLEKLNCDSRNISKCMENNILKTKSYIEETSGKAYLLNKEFATSVYDVVSKYDMYLKNKKN